MVAVGQRIDYSKITDYQFDSWTGNSLPLKKSFLNCLISYHDLAIYVFSFHFAMLWFD